MGQRRERVFFLGMKVSANRKLSRNLDVETSGESNDPRQAGTGPAIWRSGDLKTEILNHLGYQIVVMRFRDLAAIKFSRCQLLMLPEIIDEKFPVNLRSMHLGAAFPEELRFL